VATSSAVRRAPPRLRAAALCALAALLAGTALGAESFDALATRPQIERRFAELRASRALAVDKPLLWSYRFSGADGRKLEALSVQLVERGYRIDGLAPGPKGLAVLTVSRVEQHTAASLERRAAELRGLAADARAGSYDGAAAAPPP
jgi:hypothetical protein